MPRSLSTRAEAVQALGLDSPRALDRLIERGAPKPRSGKPGTRRYDVEALRAWRDDRQARSRPSLDLQTERAKLARVQTQLAQLKISELRGELIRERDVADALRAIVGATRAQLLAVPRRAVLAGLPRDHEPLVRRLVVEALRDLSEARTVAALVGKVDAEGAA